MKAEKVTSVGSVVLSFLASQHHTLHMMIMTAGMGGAGMSFMTAYPALRRAMLLLALIMTGVTAYQLLRRRQPAGMLIAGVASVLLSLGMMAWSVVQFGI